jgi:hypothetical protein
MKRSAVLAALVIAVAAVARAGGDEKMRMGGGVMRRSVSPAPQARSAAPRSSGPIYRRQRVVVPRATAPAPERIMRDRNRPVYPQRNETGGPIRKSPTTVPPVQHHAVVSNTTLVRNISVQQRTEVIPNRYYWHNAGGVRYSHYYDGRWHWYGFYHGPTFYWCRYYGNYWWWYDPFFFRWVFWWDGFWWWPGPGGVEYVYVDNNYYPYEGDGVVVEHEVNPPAPDSVPAPGSGSTTNSPDGKRMVQVFGDEGQAFLYDKTAAPPTFMKYLGQGVAKVRFSAAATGGATQLLVEYKDDTFAIFDEDGNAQSSVAPTGSAAPTPPETPDAIPPPPTSAPGQ